MKSNIVDAGWRSWTFVKVEIDDGIAGWGECGDDKTPHGVVGADVNEEALAAHP